MGVAGVCRLIGLLGGVVHVVPAGGDCATHTNACAVGGCSYILADVLVPVWCSAVLFYLLSIVAWLFSPLLRGAPLHLRLLLWTFLSSSTSAPVSPSTSAGSDSDVSGEIGFLGQNFIVAEFVFPCRQSTCCEIHITPLSLQYTFTHSILLGCDYFWAL